MSSNCPIDSERYEELRAQAAGESPRQFTPRGLALFLRSGMAAWVGAWSDPASLRSDEKQDKPLRHYRAKSVGLCSEVASLVAGMVLSALRGESDS